MNGKVPSTMAINHGGQRPGPCLRACLRAKVTAMSLRLATFNVENLMNRFDFSGYRNQLNEDRTLALFDIQSEAEYRLLEQARAIAHPTTRAS